MNVLTVPLQLFIVAFLVFAFSRVWLRVREGTIGWGMFLFWTLVWVLALAAVVKPGVTTKIANRLGVGRGVDAVLYVSIVVLFYLNFRALVLVENLRHEITRLTREIALREAKKTARKQ